MLHYTKLQTQPDVICISATADASFAAAAGAAPGSALAAGAAWLEGDNEAEEGVDSGASALGGDPCVVQLERTASFAYDKVPTGRRRGSRRQCTH